MACATYTCGLPTATGTVSSKAVIEVATGEVFNGGQKNYDRGSGACSGLSEGDREDAVFYLHKGATLQNVTIGANQAEGVHCTLKFFWFEDVYKDAITIKNDEAGNYDTNIIGGGAYHAEDKVIQHNGCGTINIINFFVSDRRVWCNDGLTLRRTWYRHADAMALTLLVALIAHCTCLTCTYILSNSHLATF
ncbi:pectin lyase-like protein [Armillaria solidipes]|uniref:Pectate lyase n=1 Tax=Armillaria solidipes TaxID=1076256 RepID=A0A2H3B3X3_9AGAR|nr:pectin lyase-like protein [Armillaria solidipes]